MLGRWRVRMLGVVPCEPMQHNQVQGAEIVLSCGAIDDDLAFFTDTLGFRLESIAPADDPSTAVISGHRLRIRLVRSKVGAPASLRLLCRDPAAVAGGATELTAPHGTKVELVLAEPPVVVPSAQQAFLVTRLEDGAPWVVGRAGMRYRDLVPGRQGGRVIASHIFIADAGPVPDYVHYHQVRFQMIFCYRGWVRVVYEDQGPPFLLQAGDCVLQPPQIRHRVLESSAEAEVIELTSPAEHGTFVDHELALPTQARRPDRAFSGQRFVHHRADAATWQPWRLDGFECRDTGIADATNGLASVAVVRPRSPMQPVVSRDHGDLLFMFVLDGAMTLRCEARPDEPLRSGDAVVVPAQLPYSVAACSRDLELLEVTCASRLWPRGSRGTLMRQTP